jgi:hypothetical protein
VLVEAVIEKEQSESGGEDRVSEGKEAEGRKKEAGDEGRR